MCPIYEFDCVMCGTFEIIRNLNDPEIKFCPECGSEVMRLISAPCKPILKSGDAVTEKREYRGEKSNVVNLPKVDIFEQFDKRRAEERRKVKKEKDRKFKAK